MKPITKIAAKPAAAIGAGLLAAATLVACGSHHYNPPAEPAPTPGPVVDAFFATVSALVANSPDDTEPISSDSATATAPEDSEPQPLG